MRHAQARSGGGLWWPANTDIEIPAPAADAGWHEPDPPRRTRFLPGLLIGLVVGLLAAGPAGYLAGVRLTGDKTTATIPTRPTSPTAGPRSGSLPPYEQAQLQANKPKFTGDLAGLAAPWLPWIATCNKSGEPGGPQLNEGEQTRILCTYGAVSVYFVQYKGLAERDKARTRLLGQNVDARTLAPGVAEPSRRPPTSGTSTGNYVEFAYKSKTVDDPVCGLWWDSDSAPVAGYLLGYWESGLGKSWAPLRDVWQRTS